MKHNRFRFYCLTATFKVATRRDGRCLEQWKELKPEFVETIIPKQYWRQGVYYTPSLTQQGLVIYYYMNRLYQCKWSEPKQEVGIPPEKELKVLLMVNHKYLNELGKEITRVYRERRSIRELQMCIRKRRRRK